MFQIVKLWNKLSKRRHTQFYLLLVTMIITSFLEIVSIGAVFPFLGILTQPEKVYQHYLTQPVIQILGLSSPTQLILPLTAAFIFAAIITALFRLLLLFTVTRLSFAAGTDIGIDIYRRSLYQSYSVQIARNSSEVINGIVVKTKLVIAGILNPALTLISSIIMLISVLTVLFAIDVTIALASSLSFGILYLIVIFLTRQQLKENSKHIADKSTQIVKTLQEGLGGIRDILINGNQEFYCKHYFSADSQLRSSMANNIIISAFPRNAMEAIGMIFIATMAYVLSQRGDGLLAAIPLLGAFALGAQRLLPALQQAYSSYSIIKGSRSTFDDVMVLIEQPLPYYADQPLPSPIPFEKEIILKNISFRYNEDTPWVFKEITLKIDKGSRIGFIGITGSGKSTLLDIVMGLLRPSEGIFSIDGKKITENNFRSWQAHISHVPQNIFLSDSSIEENIAFGIHKGKIDQGLVQIASKKAQIAETIENWPKQYQTIVGERGIRLSGGQRQRIGIARALYKQTNVLIFDEATNALDHDTENSVMSAIDSLDKDLTILIIAHRMTTLEGCDQVFEFKKSGEVSIRRA